MWSLGSLTSGSAGLFEALVLEEGADFDGVLGEASAALIVGFLLRLEVRVPFGDSSFGSSTGGLEFRAEVDFLAGVRFTSSSTDGDDLGARVPSATVFASGPDLTSGGVFELFSLGAVDLTGVVFELFS